jgi:hypothetical protein
MVALKQLIGLIMADAWAEDEGEIATSQLSL